jgi:hypothetical protein
MTFSEPISEAEGVLRHDPGEARWVWEEAARIYGLHTELANLYRNKSNDKRTINKLWELIEEGEYALRTVGVSL